MELNDGDFVMVTTSHRGVFAGEFVSRVDETRLTLRNVRMCVYWSADVRGVVSLASIGPTKGCRVSHAAPEVELVDVTSVSRCSDAAKAAWEAEPWG